jgi:hypothetical protein
MDQRQADAEGTALTWPGAAGRDQVSYTGSYRKDCAKRKGVAADTLGRQNRENAKNNAKTKAKLEEIRLNDRIGSDNEAKELTMSHSEISQELLTKVTPLVAKLPPSVREVYFGISSMHRGWDRVTQNYPAKNGWTNNGQKCSSLTILQSER